MAKLQGRIALITGGSSGIGLATAKLFQEEGARVIVTGRSKEGLEKVPKELGSQVSALQSETSKLDEIDKLMQHAREKYGRIDILFVNAGIVGGGSIDKIDETLFDRVFDINVKGLYFTIQRALPLIPDGGVILLTASAAVRRTSAGASVYAASKAAVCSIGRSLGLEFAPRRIRVNTISPGPIATPILTKSGMVTEEDLETFQLKLRESAALKRIGGADEVARVALFLASDDASYVTAAEFVVDGGFSELR